MDMAKQGDHPDGIPMSRRSTRSVSTPELTDPPSGVVGLHVMPSGPRFLFDSVPGEKGRACLLIGASNDCDFQIAHDSVSDVHCAVVLQLPRRNADQVRGDIALQNYHLHVHDLGSKNGVKVGGRRVTSFPLYDGSIFTIGDVDIVAIGQENLARNTVIAGSTIIEFLRNAVKAYGSKRAAAEAIGLPYSTLRDWLKRRMG